MHHRTNAPQISEAAELWTISALAEYVATHAIDAGFARLSQAGKSTVWRILDVHELKPH